MVLTSGGLDSSTLLAMAIADGRRPLALGFRYGQLHVAELEAARQVAGQLGAQEWLELELPLGAIGGSSLVGDGPVPDATRGEGAPAEIPSTYVPARNTIFLSLALGLAEARGIRAIYIGANAVDYSGYPDCRGAYLKAFERLANLGTRRGVEHPTPWFEINAPLLTLSKAEIIRRGTELGVDYSLTVSCYRADAAGRACGRCDSCSLRRRGFLDAGIPDPTRYLPMGS